MESVPPEKKRYHRHHRDDKEYADEGPAQALEFVEDLVPVQIFYFVTPSHTVELYPCPERVEKINISPGAEAAKSQTLRKGG
ncbi:MAG TPA: hypothetical protein VF372_03665 [Thermodesulfobacteriota bacterium]